MELLNVAHYLTNIYVINLFCIFNNPLYLFRNIMENYADYIIVNIIVYWTISILSTKFWPWLTYGPQTWLIS